MPSYNVQYLTSQSTGSFVVDDQFGANVLHGVNTEHVDTYSLTAGFEDSLINQGITNLRFPGGHVENTLDVTFMPDGQLRSEVREFLEWCVDNSTNEMKYEVTFVLPTKSHIPASQIEDFTYALLREFGDTVTALEIGNEYSIGTEVDTPDRSTHPEYIDGSDFIPAMNEVEYGLSANIVINAVQDAIDRLEIENSGSGAYDPDILLQMAETNGSASNYHRGVNAGNFDLANETILSVIDDRAQAAIDGAVVHYYYNVDRENGMTFDDAVDWREIRRIDSRFENFQEHLGREVGLYITEWNVVAGNTTQHGAASASILLEMFEFMVRLDVSDAHIWPLQHRAVNNIFGNRSSEEIESGMGGAAFSMMSESLRPMVSSTGHVNSFESMLSEWDGRGNDGEVEVNHFSSTYQDVLFVSLRSDSPSTIDIDLGNLTDNDSIISIERLTIDSESSDGLSDLADEDGQNRLGRRTIDQLELTQLQTLAFFDSDNVNHLKVTEDGRLTTYIPPFDTIIPLTPSPRDIDDYYFTSEVDVDPLRIVIDPPTSPTESVSLDVMPYDVVRINIDNINHISGDGTNELLTGGIGRDSLLGRNGNDTLIAGEGDDTLKGGWGDDFLNGNLGHDHLVSGAGSDEMHGGDGNDVLVLTGGSDLAFGENGNDLIELTSSDQFGAGLNATHVMTDRYGYESWTVSLEGYTRYSTVVVGGNGTDQIQLGSDNDAFFLDNTFSDQHASLGTGSVARVVGVEVIRAGAGDDIIDLTSNQFEMDSGVDIHGQNGDDTLWGSNGNDHLYGGNGDDMLDGCLGQDILTGGAGADSFHFTEPENFTHQITDFSTSEGDVIVLHLPHSSHQSGLSFDAQGTVLRLVDDEGGIALSVDVGSQASSLAAQSVSNADWFEFA